MVFWWGALPLVGPTRKRPLRRSELAADRRVRLDALAARSAQFADRRATDGKPPLPVPVDRLHQCGDLLQLDDLRDLSRLGRAAERHHLHPRPAQALGAARRR